MPSLRRRYSIRSCGRWNAPPRPASWSSSRPATTPQPNTYAGITSPANAPSALTTGAVETNRTPVRREDWVADYSARGPTWFDAYAKPDFVAPGSRLISNTTIDSTLFKVTGSKTIAGPVYEIPDLSTTGRISIDGNPFLQLSGTSMAAGVVERRRRPGAGSQSARRRASADAQRRQSDSPIHRHAGDGEQSRHADAGGGADQCRLAPSHWPAQVDTTVPLGGWWLTNGVDESTQFGVPDGVSCALPACQVETWSRNIIWGSDVLAGDLVYRNLLIWARNILWGTDVVWGTETASVCGHRSQHPLGHRRKTLGATGSNILWGTRTRGAGIRS